MGIGITEKNEKRLRELGITISTCRKIRGMSQKELARETGISRSLMSIIEAPGVAYNFTLDVLFNIADALGVKADGTGKIELRRCSSKCVLKKVYPVVLRSKQHKSITNMLV